jgi:hypothetical protein
MTLDRKRAQGMPGVRRTRSLARSKKTRELVTTGSPKHSGIPCAMVLTVSFVLFPVIGLFVTVIGGLVCRFNASVEASEPHDFAVRALSLVN